MCKVWLKHNPTHSFAYCLYNGGVESLQQNGWQSLNYLLSGPLQERFADLCSRLHAHALSLFCPPTMCSRLSTKIPSFHANTSMMQPHIVDITFMLPDNTAVSLWASCVNWHHYRDNAVATLHDLDVSHGVDLSALSSISQLSRSHLASSALLVKQVCGDSTGTWILTALTWGLSK